MMLRSQINSSRCQQHIRWLEALSLTIVPAAESVRDHFHSVVVQINNQLESAHRDNTVLSEDAQLPVLQAAVRRLQDKCVALWQTAFPQQLCSSGSPFGSSQQQPQQQRPMRRIRKLASQTLTNFSLRLPTTSASASLCTHCHPQH